MTTRSQIKASLLKSIQDLGDHNYSYPCSGYQIELVLDPDSAELYLFEHVGAGTPERVWHNRHRNVCAIPEDAIPASVVDTLEGKLDYLADMVEAYEGSEWNGSNHVGRWADDWDDRPDPDYWNKFEIQSYWDASVWFEGSDHEILDLAAKGYAPSDILPELDLGDQYNGEVKPEAALEYVTELIEEHRGE